jgi:hypothetical protein
MAGAGGIAAGCGAAAGAVLIAGSTFIAARQNHGRRRSENQYQFFHNALKIFV